LAIHTYTEPEWAQRNTMAPESPQCMGGSKAAISFWEI
jgi:BolA protein